MYTCTVQVLTTAVIGMDAPNMVGSVLPKSPLEMTESTTILFCDNVTVFTVLRQQHLSTCACVWPCINMKHNTR